MVAVTKFKSRMAEIGGELKGMVQEEAMLGAREGATSALSDILVRVRGLLVSGANRDALSFDERAGLQLELDGLLGAIDFVSQTSRFKGIQLLTGYNTTNLGRGAATDANGATLGLADLKSGGALNLLTGDLDRAQKVIEAASRTVSSDRASLGGRLVQMDALRGALETERQNIESARSLIEDADYAEETGRLVRGQTLEEIARFVKQMAEEQRASAVLELLKGVKRGA